MKDFFDELMHADSIPEVLARNKSQVVKLLLILVVIGTICFVYVYRTTGELQVSDAAAEAQTKQAGDAKTGQSPEGAAEVSEEYGTVISTPNGSYVDTDGVIFVDIGGAVKEPMVAELPAGSRVEDAIQAAGGTLKKADLTGINRAELLTDGQKIYIPRKGEDAEKAVADNGGSVFEKAQVPSEYGEGRKGGMVDINSADSTVLQSIPGVGPVTAQKIIDYREQNGSFKTTEELKNISGIGDKTYEKMQDYVTI